jgi:hypothetical protein
MTRTIPLLAATAALLAPNFAQAELCRAGQKITAGCEQPGFIDQPILPTEPAGGVTILPGPTNIVIGDDSYAPGDRLDPSRARAILNPDAFGLPDPRPGTAYYAIGDEIVQADSLTLGYIARVN